MMERGGEQFTPTMQLDESQTLAMKHIFKTSVSLVQALALTCKPSVSTPYVVWVRQTPPGTLILTLTLIGRAHLGPASPMLG